MQPLRQALFLAFLALSLLQVDAYVAQTRSGTNAARLAHGQPLVRPKRLFHPGLNVARDLAPSGTPTTPGTSSSVVTPSSDPSSSAASDSATPTSASSSAVSSSDSATPTSASASSSVSPPPSSSASPSSSSSAPTPTAPAPGTVLTGRVGIYTTNTGTTTPVKRDDATFVGYLGAYGVTTESDGSLASGPWVYTYTVPASSSQPVNLDHSGTPYRLSAVAIRSGPQVTLGPGNSVYLQAENTRANTPAGSATSTYVYDTYAIGYAQTAVWILDSATGLVTCQWVNPDGSRPRVYSVKSGSGLYLTGDIAALRSQLGNPSDFTQVDLYHLTTSH